LILCVLSVLCGVELVVGAAEQLRVPKAWDARELASFELPLVRADRSAQHAAPDYYYRLAVRPIYKSYPIYEPGREPPVVTTSPVTARGFPRKAEWIAAIKKFVDVLAQMPA